MTISESLDGVRVLEISHTPAAAQAGKLLASYGAEVTVLNRELRGCGHCLIPLVAASAFDVGKLTSDGAGAGTFDVVITDEPCCPRAQATDTPQSQVQSDERIIVRISTYGSELSGAFQGGGSALTASAVSGASTAIGHPGARPLSHPTGVVESVTGMNAAAACVALLTSTEPQGNQPCVIEVSMAGVLEYFVGMNNKMFEGYPRTWHREGRRSSGSSGPYPLSLFEAADGSIGLIGRSREDWANVLTAMGDPLWAADPKYRDPWHVAEHLADEVDVHVQAWVRKHTVAEMVALAERFNFIAGPVLSVAETFDQEQYHQRDFWSLDGEGRILGPGLAVSRRDGGRTGEVATESVKPEKRFTGPRRQGHVVEPSRLLEGIRVLDFTWVWAGPLTTAILASLGAEVIKVEHPSRPDGARLRGRPRRSSGESFEGPAEEVTPYFHQNAAGKLSFGASLASSTAVHELRELAKGCDVLVENMRPGVLERRGLGYRTLVEENPGLIQLSMSVAGQEGPLSTMRGYAPLMSGFGGMEGLIGYSPDDVTGSYTFAIADPIAGVYGALTILAALRDRQRTGVGEWLDMSQIEAVMSQMTIPFASAITGHPMGPAGNADERFILQDTFPCEDGCWLALTVRSEAELHSLTRLIGAGDQSATSPGCVDAIWAGVVEWSRGLQRDNAVKAMIDAGLAAAPVLEWHEDSVRRSFSGDEASVSLYHPYNGRERIFVPPWTYDGTRPSFLRRAPLLGEHTGRILAAAGRLTQADDALIRGELYRLGSAGDAGSFS